MHVFGEVWYNELRLQGLQFRTMFDYVIERDRSMDKIGVGAQVKLLPPWKETGGVGNMRADVIGAEFPFLRVIGNMVKENKDGIAPRELVFRGYDLDGPFVECTIGRGGCVVVRLKMCDWVVATGGGPRSSRHCLRALWCCHWDGRLLPPG